MGVNAKKKGEKVKSETPNQCAREWPGLGKLAPGRRRVFPLPKQGAKLHYCGKSWSLDRLWANASRPRHHRTAVSYAWTRALGCHEDQQLDRVFGIRESWAIRQQIKCAKAKSAREEINRPGGKTHRGFCFASRNDGFLAVTSVFFTAAQAVLP